MMKTSEKYKRANDLLNQDKYNEALKLYLEVIQEEDSDVANLSVYISVCYYNIGQFQEAYTFAKKAIELNGDDELASLGFYLACIELDKSEEAIDELNRFLTTHKADLYRDTIKELIEDIQRGYATKFKETVSKLAKKNDIPLPPNFSDMPSEKE